MKKTLLIVAVIVAVLVVAKPASAAPCLASTTMNQSGSVFICPDFIMQGGNKVGVEVAGFGYQISAPANSSGGENIVCESVGGNGGVCLSGGDPTDGQVVLQNDWGNPLIAGCPTGRVVYFIQCADGSGLAVSVSGALGDFSPDWATPFDGANFTNLTSGNQAGRPVLTSFTGGVLTMHFNKVHVFSDCDPASAGAQFGGCTDSFDGNSFQIGNIYTSNQPCGQSPSTDRTKWTLATPANRVNNADGSVDASLTVTLPATGCFYVGSTTTPTGGVEGNGISGFVSVAPQGAAKPDALGIQAKTSNGKVVVTFYTETEYGLAGFNVYTQSNKGLVKLNSALIAAKGGPSSYVQSFARGSIGGGKSIIVETLMTDGTSHKSAPVPF